MAMQKTADKLERARARKAFRRSFASSGDYRRAAADAGISERTARRWLAIPSVGQASAEPPGEAAPTAGRGDVTPSEPVAATPFVGRARELESLERSLSGGARLVSLCGPPGMGKTRTVRELARRWSLRTREPSCFCDLVTKVSLDDVARALADALHVPLTDSGAASSIEHLGDVLAGRGPQLLVLDNFEQLVELGARTIAVWLRRAPELRVVVGTRARLRLSGEVVHELGPLGLPARADETPGRLVASDAGALLLARLGDVRPDLDVGDAEERALCELASWLEGIPLAIELSAAQLAHVDATRFAEHIGQRIDLTSTVRDADPHQRTLRSAIDRSWAMLSPDERAVLAQSTVFRGGFDAVAARAVLRPESPGVDPLAVVGSLREHSLLRATGKRELSGELSFSSYESIREYAAEKLDAGDRAEAVARHAAYFVSHGSRLAGEVDGPSGTAARHRLAVDLENLLAAHQHSLDAGTGDGARDALGITLAVHRFLLDRGPLALGASLLDSCLEAAERSGLSEGERARGLVARAEVRLSLGQLRDAGEDLARARALLVLRPDPRIGASLAWALAELALVSGRLAESVEIARAGLRELDEHDAAGSAVDGREGTLARARLLLSAAIAMGDAGGQDDAEETYLEARELLRRVGDRRTEAILLRHLAHQHLQVETGDPIAELGEAMALAEASDNRRLVADITLSLGAATHDRGNFSAAHAHYAQADALYARLGLERGRATTLAMHGELFAERGELGRASICLHDARSLAHGSGDERIEGFAQVRLGGVAAAMGHLEQARRWVSRGTTLLERSKDMLFLGVAHLKQGEVALCEARAADARGDLETAALARARAARALVVPPSRSAPHRCEDVRIARRMLERGLARVASVDEPAASVLRLDVDGAWFEWEGEPRVVLHGRPVLRRVLAELARRRIEATGEGATVDQLVAAGWGDERILPAAAASRVRMTVSRLRTLGLGEAIVHEGGVYALGPDVVVEQRAERRSGIPPALRARAS